MNEKERRKEEGEDIMKGDLEDVNPKEYYHFFLMNITRVLLQLQ